MRALATLESSELPLGSVLDDLDLPDEARPFARELLSGVLRWRSRLDWTLAPLLKKSLSALDPPVRAALRLALYERVALQTPAHSVANEYANLIRRARLASAVAFVNAIARRLPGEWRAATGSQRDALAAECAHPAWLVGRWAQKLGWDEARSLCEANNVQAALDVRVNTARATREQVLASLRERALDASETLLSPDGIRLKDAGSPLGWPEWGAGQVIAQDEAAQLVARVASPREGARVLDVASAPGGKATHLAQMVGPSGRVVAADRAPGRLRLVRDNARRLGLEQIETFEGDAAQVLGAVREGKLPLFDVVLLDAPCTGTGTLRRRPDLKWRKSLAQIEELRALQSQLLHTAAQCVQPGGHLVYSTCSLEDEENAAQVKGWLERHGEFSIDAPEPWSEEAASVRTEDGFWQTWPHRHGCDGMFAARLRLDALPGEVTP
jgi:16S rRNA (cytosine967-C5)-methyltransferase